jgi:ABC-2 type transport system permease protein
MIRAGNGMRLRGLMVKEFLQIRRDPSAIAIAFVMPLVLLLLFGYGISLDARDIRLALVADAPGPATAGFFSGFQGSPYFRPRHLPSLAAAKALMRQGGIDGIVHLPVDFASRLHEREGASIHLIVDGVDANTARIIQGYVEGVWALWMQRLNRELEPPVVLEQRIWFNSQLRSRNYLVPGLIAVIMTLIGALLTAMVVAREWERGTMEALLVTPVTMREIILGKVLPYFALAMGGMLLSVVMALWLFDVPLRGSLWLLGLSSALYVVVALGMGLLISIIARNQFVAGQAAIVVTFLPAFILSGFIFDIASMPLALQLFTHVIAARYFVSILQTVFLAGDLWSVILPNALALLLMALVFFTLAARKARKRLE